MKLEQQIGVGVRHAILHVPIANDHVLPNSVGNNRCLPAMCIPERKIAISREGTFANSRRTVQVAAQVRRSRCQAKGECRVEICLEKTKVFYIQKLAKVY